MNHNNDNRRGGEVGGGGRGVASGSYKWKKIILGAKEGKSEERWGNDRQFVRPMTKDESAMPVMAVWSEPKGLKYHVGESRINLINKESSLKGFAQVTQNDQNYTLGRLIWKWFLRGEKRHRMKKEKACYFNNPGQSYCGHQLGQWQWKWKVVGQSPYLVTNC